MKREEGTNIAMELSVEIRLDEEKDKDVMKLRLEFTKRIVNVAFEEIDDLGDGPVALERGVETFDDAWRQRRDWPFQEREIRRINDLLTRICLEQQTRNDFWLLVDQD